MYARYILALCPEYSFLQLFFLKCFFNIFDYICLQKRDINLYDVYSYYCDMPYYTYTFYFVVKVRYSHNPRIIYLIYPIKYY